MCLLFRTAGPNKILVISGFGYSKPKMTKGGRVFQIPCFHTVDRLKLNIITLKVESYEINCSTGVPVSIAGVAQVKINADTEETLEMACQHFIGLKERDIHEILLHTMEGHQRGMISSMSIEEIFRDREQFSAKVREVATPDMMKLGVQVISYTISGVTTANGYLRALGEPAIALVRRDARIGEATATRDADIEKSKANQERDKVVYETKLEIEKQNNSRDMVKQANRQEVNIVKAIAENAERKARAEVNQSLENEKMIVKVIEKKGAVRVMEEECQLKDKQLEAGVKLEAETQKFKTEILAAAEKKQIILKNEADKFQIEEIGDAEAHAISIKATADAKVLQLKAMAYEQFGKAALVGEVIKTLPKIAAEVANPMMKTEKVTIVSSGNGEIGFKRIVTEIIGVMNEVPEGFNTITGIDLKGEIQKVVA